MLPNSEIESRALPEREPTFLLLGFKVVNHSTVFTVHHRESKNIVDRVYFPSLSLKRHSCRPRPGGRKFQWGSQKGMFNRNRRRSRRFCLVCPRECGVWIYQIFNIRFDYLVIYFIRWKGRTVYMEILLF